MAGSARLIVLHLTKIKENMIVLHTVSEEYGRRSFIVNVGKGVTMSLLLPLNILDAEVVENSKSQLWRLRGIRALYPLGGIRNNIYKNTMTLFMSEVLYRVMHEGACEPGLADWCERMILTLDAMDTDFSNFHLRFLLELGVALGFQPSPEGMAPFAGRYYREISELLTLDFAASMMLPLEGQVRNEMAASILEYISYHCETTLDIRSLKVLREIYS